MRGIVYHTGFIAEDRGSDSTWQSDDAKRIGQLADRMMYMQERGQAVLTQRRLDDGFYEYLATPTRGNENHPAFVELRAAA